MVEIKINDKIITSLSFDVDEDNDTLKIDDKLINIDKKLIYIMLNKPEGYITTVKDQFDRKKCC